MNPVAKKLELRLHFFKKTGAKDRPWIKTIKVKKTSILNFTSATEAEKDQKRQLSPFQLNSKRKTSYTVSTTIPQIYWGRQFATNS